MDTTTAAAYFLLTIWDTAVDDDATIASAAAFAVVAPLSRCKSMQNTFCFLGCGAGPSHPPYAASAAAVVVVAGKPAQHTHTHSVAARGSKLHRHRGLSTSK